ncbi:hypothetical protein D3C73_1281170 [compost metagenome]
MQLFDHGRVRAEVGDQLRAGFFTHLLELGEEGRVDLQATFQAIGQAFERQRRIPTDEQLAVVAATFDGRVGVDAQGIAWQLQRVLERLVAAQA